jgi:ribosomal protein L44E
MSSPELDWTCSQCGRTETLQLVKADHRDEPQASEPTGKSPELDWTCSRCGTTETLRLVKVDDRD